MLIKVDERSWQIGLNGEDAPRTIHFIDGTPNTQSSGTGSSAQANNSSDDWGGRCFDADKATALVEAFIERECGGEAPPVGRGGHFRALGRPVEKWTATGDDPDAHAGTRKLRKPL